MLIPAPMLAAVGSSAGGRQREVDYLLISLIMQAVACAEALPIYLC